MKPVGVVFIVGLVCWAGIAVAAVRLGPFIFDAVRVARQARRSS